MPAPELASIASRQGDNGIDSRIVFVAIAVPHPTLSTANTPNTQLGKRFKRKNMHKLVSASTWESDQVLQHAEACQCLTEQKVRHDAPSTSKARASADLTLGLAF